MSDAEFENLLDHSDECEYHARMLDEYNEAGLPLLEQIIPAGAVFGADRPVSRLGFLAALFNLELGRVSAFLTAAASSYAAAIRRTLRPGYALQMSAGGALMAGGGSEERFKSFNNSTVGNVPARLRPDSFTEAEAKISEGIAKILKSSHTPEDCQKGLEFLSEHEAVVGVSWTHTLNKARFLRGTGENEQAEHVVDGVMKQFWYIDWAMGTAFEVRSWFEELKFNETGESDRELLDRRSYYISEGLRFFPGSYQLLLNAFECALLMGKVDAAIEYLTEAVDVDREIVKQYFADNKKSAEMKGSDPRLKTAIESIEKENVEMKKARQLALSILLTISLLVPALIGAYSAGKAVKNDSFGAMIRGDGTSYGIAKIANGTSYGYQ
jgi:hypothetical protein